MASEKDKKRKRHSVDADKSVKKRSVEAGQGEVKVVHTSAGQRLCPVIASVPGIHLKPLDFDAYTKPHSTQAAGQTPDPSSHSILLQSSAHPQLDYTASAPDDHSTDNYLGVFDPSNNTLQVIPAYAVTVRSTLRSETNEVQAENAQRSKAMQREMLGMEFGTKKAKRAIASKTVNAITTETGKGVESAVLGTVNDTSTALPDKAEREAAILRSKPIPEPNLGTDKVEEIYPITQLIPKGDMGDMAVRDWQDKVKAGTAVELTSRFVAHRLQHVAKSGNIQKLKALKYMLLLLDFTAALRPNRDGRKVPKQDELRDKMSAWNETTVDSVRRRFAEGGELNKWHVDKLMTHMAAISLYIDDFKTDTHDLREDLRLENRQMTQYFNELGCRTRSPTEKEYAEFRISNKSQAAQRKVALLKLPLDFPKTRLPPKRR
ncbi:RNA polymerase I associated factor, A49-like protein [Myriangium duriaei CBS 260.36]|uniref:RNA polymerase I associated factor, A49-like protein n=1 Tax=Myriangium duriaei CBS 260.36 TaxID=1168546 RepID=A0A9P4JFS3_9PEZI|nr:RNA polymerase I associated factor, A49-like protein [Myriangium duriaei CBS 260.36]